jgi:hypothetical protein
MVRETRQPVLIRSLNGLEALSAAWRNGAVMELCGLSQ